MRFKHLVRRLMRRLGFHGVNLGRYLLVMRVAGDSAEPEVGSDPLERYLFERSLAHILRGLDVNCVLDVGANKGQYGLALRSVGYTGFIVSFEPAHEPFLVLQDIARRDPKWTAHQIALGASAARATMHVTRATDFASLRQPTQYALERFKASAPIDHDEEVEVRRLDDILARVTAHIDQPRIFLKIDAQGYDLEVFAGAGSTIEQMVGLQSEVAVVPLYEGAPGMLEALAVYQARGLEVSGLFPVAYDPDTSRILEYDCLLVRPGRFTAAPGSRFTPPGANGHARETV